MKSSTTTVSVLVASSFDIDMSNNIATTPEDMSNNNSNNTNNCSAKITKMTKRVSFSKYSQMVILDNISYTPKVIAKLWYSQTDIELFKLQYSYDMHHLLTTATINELTCQDSVYFLGLEDCFRVHGCREGYSARQHRQDIYAAVLLEQHRQRSLGIDDPQAMADVSLKESDMPRRRAALIAMMHA